MQSSRMKWYIVILGVALIAIAAVLVYSLVRPAPARDCSAVTDSVDKVLCQQGH